MRQPLIAGTLLCLLAACGGGGDATTQAQVPATSAGPGLAGARGTRRFRLHGWCPAGGGREGRRPRRLDADWRRLGGHALLGAGGGPPARRRHLGDPPGTRRGQRHQRPPIPRGGPGCPGEGSHRVVRRRAPQHHHTPPDGAGGPGLAHAFRRAVHRPDGGSEGPLEPPPGGRVRWQRSRRLVGSPHGLHPGGGLPHRPGGSPRWRAGPGAPPNPIT